MRIQTLAGVVVLIGLSLSLVACGNSSSSSTLTPPGPSFLYAVVDNSLQSGQILTFPIDASTGALGAPTSMASPQPPFGPFSLDGTKFLYLCQRPVTQITSQIYGYAIDETTGALTAISSSPFAPPTTTILNGAIATNNFLYIGGNSFLSGGLAPTISAFDIASDGSLASSVSGSPFDAAPPTNVLSGAGPWVVSQSQFVYTSEFEGSSGQPGGVAAFKMEPTTGVLTSVSGSPFSTGPVGSPGQIVYDTALGPFVYVALSNPPSFQNLIAGFSVNQSTGALTPVPGSPFAAASTATMVLDPSGQFLFTGSSGTNIVGFKIGSDGSLTALPGSPAIAVAPFVFSGNHLYTASTAGTIAAFNLDETTGALTPVAGSPFNAALIVRDLVSVTLPQP
jgi:6-phosphogluconolactonase